MIRLNVLKKRKCIIDDFKPRNAVTDFKFKAVIKAEPNTLYDADIINFNAQLAFINNKAYDFNDIILLQYTGYKDKNNIDIYEGDIIKFSNQRGNKIDVTITEVIYEDGSFLIKDNCTYFDTYVASLDGNGTEVERIGNVYTDTYKYHAYSINIKGDDSNDR